MGSTIRTIIGGLAVAAMLAGTSTAAAREGGAHAAVPGPACNKQHLAECQKAIRYWKGQANEAQDAVAWQKATRVHDTQRLLERLRGPSEYVYAAKLAYLSCRAFLGAGARCPTPNEIIAQGSCESGLQDHDPNPISTADGWMQYLSGTWDNNTAGQLGWSRYDTLAMGIQTAAIVSHDGGWRQWSCQNQYRDMGVSAKF
jgi:hypothetical protein